MPEIHVKTSERSNPEDEYSYPGYREALRQSPQLMAQMKFDSPAQERDYLRRVRSSRHNVPGMPTFYPADRIVNKHRLPVVYNCTNCDAEIPRMDAKCDICGHIDLKCEHCAQFLIEGKLEDGRSFCRRCGQPLTQVTQ